MFSFSPWAYDTSEESSVSLLVAAGGAGTLYFKNGDDGSTFNVGYNYLAIGPSAGGEVNFAQSTTSMWSQGTNVFTVYGDFGPDSFPCTGFFVLAGASGGGGNPSQSPGGGGALPGNGAGTCLTIFNDGLMGAPKAAVLFQGALNAVLPSVGFGVAQVTFEGAGNADDGGGGGSDWDDGS
jgi:hypothetical protein